MMRKHVVGAVFRRNFVSYFSSPTGYVFITVFITLCAYYAFWDPRFFIENLANLDQLNRVFPLLLLFIIPAITMSLWAEERRQGTDELLMTLPANDLELVLGKYLAALGIYSVALAFASSFVLVLQALGAPDWGIMFGNYFAFWLLGALLISVGMVGSLLTSSMTVAFILGSALCGGMVLGVRDFFTEMSTGVLPLESVLYFVALIVVMLYTNLILVGRRHLRRTDQGVHLSIRAVCLLVAAVSLMVLGGRLGWRTDLSAARLHSLSDATRRVIDNVKSDRPVYIHAYISPEVPKSYVDTQRTLRDLLEQFRVRGNGRIFLNLVETERYTQAAREADERFSIRAQQVQFVEEGDQPDSEPLFLGVAFTCGAEETVIPFMDRGLSVEYELTRSLAVVTGQARKKVAIATTDAKMFGGFDFQAMRSDPAWSIVQELRKQYEVSELSLDQPVTGNPDVLIVGLPSSLTQPQMDNLMTWIKAGHPVLLLDDPFPGFNGTLAPTEPRRNPRQSSPFGPPPPPADPKGNIMAFLKTLGIHWNTEDLAWDMWNPHPRYKDIPLEFVFTGPGSGNLEAFNPTQPVSSGLQEMVFIFPGRIQASPDSSLTYTPLVKTTVKSGVNSIRNCYRPGFLGQKQFQPPTQHYPDASEQTLAAHVSGSLPGPDAKPGPAVNVVFVADLDFIHEQFFGIRAQGFLKLDNVTFILNCVDALAGDEGLIEVRKRQRKHRTLTTVEALTKEHKDRELEENKKAEEEAKKKLDEAQKRLDDAVKEIRESDQWDDQTKQRMIKAKENVENRRLEVDKKVIEDHKAARIERSKTDTEMAIKSIQDGIKWATLLLPPIPALILAIIIFVRQKSREGRMV